MSFRVEQFRSSGGTIKYVFRLFLNIKCLEYTTIYCKFYIFKCFRNNIERINFSSFLVCNILGGSVAEWLACWTQQTVHQAAKLVAAHLRVTT